jgi:inner membrane protein
MDPLSQGVLGAAAAQLVADRERARWAALLGGLSGMAPDLDVLIRSSHDSLLFLEYHRQFTHALAFIPLGALLCACVFYPFARGRISARDIYRFCLLGFATHGLLDACTSYGTQLWWPFSDVRVAWSNISIVDPMFTVPLLMGVCWTAVRRAPPVARLACAWAVAYLLIGVVQRERAEDFGQIVASERGHTVSAVAAKPAFGSLLLWKTIYRAQDRYFVDAVRLGWRPKSVPGDSAVALDLERDLPWLKASTQQALDLERFRRFSQGFIALDPERADAVIDIRYSLLPNRIEALWGVQFARDAAPDQHAVFFSSRNMTDRHRAEFRRMLFE